MVDVIKCVETGMATILVKSSGGGSKKIDILADELEQAAELARQKKYNALREYLLGFNPEFTSAIDSVGIDAVAKALLNPRI